MDYTREPIIETVITPREGFKLAVRNSKGGSQEEYFVDAVELVSFGGACFFRSIERPKNFLVPVTDYEVMEVRETRMVLKTVGASAKGAKAQKEAGNQEKAKKEAPKPEKKRERRRTRKRREDKGPEEASPEEGKKKEEESGTKETPKEVSQTTEAQPPVPDAVAGTEGEDAPPPNLSVAPPPKLISETISEYREKEEYKGAFFDREEGADAPDEKSTANAESDQPKQEATQPEV